MSYNKLIILRGVLAFLPNSISVYRQDVYYWQVTP